MKTPKIQKVNLAPKSDVPVSPNFIIHFTSPTKVTTITVPAEAVDGLAYAFHIALDKYHVTHTVEERKK